MTDQYSTSPSMQYVLGTAISDYDEYCPITRVELYLDENGQYKTNDDVIVQDQDIIEKPGFLVLELGSIEKDHTLESAAGALFNSLYMLFSACGVPVDYEKIRTTIELSEFMKLYRDNYSHIILIGHGHPNGIPFLDKSDPIGGSELTGLLGSDQSNNNIQIISLCCHSGCISLAKALSNGENITEVIAPTNTFDLRWAVHFITGFFLGCFISGKSVDESLAVSAKNSGDAPMCIWRKGELVGDCKV